MSSPMRETGPGEGKCAGVFNPETFDGGCVKGVEKGTVGFESSFVYNQIWPVFTDRTN